MLKPLIPGGRVGERRAVAANEAPRGHGRVGGIEVAAPTGRCGRVMYSFVYVLSKHIGMAHSFEEDNGNTGAEST